METKNEVIITAAMKEMLTDCRDRELFNSAPRTDYDLATAKKLVHIGFLQPKTIISRNNNASVTFYVTMAGADYLGKLQRRVPPRGGEVRRYAA
jgi:hypothetical protein